ncbi:UNKNOWN [Stylonychia lemnae]|uniref:Uncharacterized protein n=1 Tax=Stylonychia lemnae TaxID=5949 RepID=A0A078ARS2_STYLE|nr:UNKNOWN [Stylonychia lemnae]|eukprot:CDW83887.1 UNKNOWN [Stylonychia lemnae]
MKKNRSPEFPWERGLSFKNLRKIIYLGTQDKWLSPEILHSITMKDIDESLKRGLTLNRFLGIIEKDRVIIQYLTLPKFDPVSNMLLRAECHAAVLHRQDKDWWLLDCAADKRISPLLNIKMPLGESGTSFTKVIGNFRKEDIGACSRVRGTCRGSVTANSFKMDRDLSSSKASEEEKIHTLIHSTKKARDANRVKYFTLESDLLLGDSADQVRITQIEQALQREKRRVELIKELRAKIWLPEEGAFLKGFPDESKQQIASIAYKEALLGAADGQLKKIKDGLGIEAYRNLGAGGVKVNQDMALDYVKERLIDLQDEALTALGQ